MTDDPGEKREPYFWLRRKGADFAVLEADWNLAAGLAGIFWRDRPGFPLSPNSEGTLFIEINDTEGGHLVGNDDAFQLGAALIRLAQNMEDAETKPPFWESAEDWYGWLRNLGTWCLLGDFFVDRRNSFRFLEREIIRNRHRKLK
jgi:hypothetical protein